jgi:hypothetical protein
MPKSLYTESAPESCRAAEDGCFHIVGWWQWVFGDVLKFLRLTTPRGLCGASLEGDPDRPDPAETNAPDCQRCVDLNAGWRTEMVPGYWVGALPWFSRGQR